MANYYETYRTNYFGVKNVKEFTELLSTHDIPHIVYSSAQIEETGKVFTNEKGNVLIPPRQLFFVGDIMNDPPGIYDEDIDDFTSLDAIISKHLLDSDVCILIYVGNEKLRYIQGGVMTIYPETTGITFEEQVKRFGNLNISLDQEISLRIDEMNIQGHNRRVIY